MHRRLAYVMAVMILTGMISSGCSTNKIFVKKQNENNTTKEDTLKNSTTASGTNKNNVTGTDKKNTTGSDLTTSTKAQDKGPEVEYKKVKALYLTGWTAGIDSSVQKYIQLANTTEINAYVIDIKDNDGYVGYESNIPAVREAGAWKYKYNADKVLQQMHENNIYVIGRLAVFNDPVYPSKRQDLAVKNYDGSLYRDRNKYTWLNPYNKESWSYTVEIAREAVQKGFDEIQFDYVRFPNDGAKNNIDYGNNQLQKYEIINEFLAYAKKELPGVRISSDVFGIICESPADAEGIGQHLEEIGKDVDAISPMVYPSHYAVGQIVNGVQYSKPDLDPYGVVYSSMLKAKNRIAKVENYRAHVRPYLQAFTASWLGAGYYQKYGAEQIRQQIQATYDAGYDEWILWDPSNNYPQDAFMQE